MSPSATSIVCPVKLLAGEDNELVEMMRDRRRKSEGICANSKGS